MNKIYDVLIIGAGASGLFLASNLHGLEVAILEKNSCAGKKILASGGGKCNITNRYISSQNYLGDEEFIAKALLNLSFCDVLEFFAELQFKEIKQNQFFCTSSARDVLGVLLRSSEQNKAKIFYNCDVKSASKISNSKNCEAGVCGDLSNSQNEIFEILTHNGQKFRAKNLVVASGGLSYKALGASDIGYLVAQNFGLQVTKTAPALVGFTVQKDEFWFKNLSGVSLNAEISLNTKNILGLKFKDQDKPNSDKKTALSERKFSADVLFTHKGISGPAVLSASLFWSKGAVRINFLPNFDTRCLSRTKKQLSTILPLPRRFTLEFLKANGLEDMIFGEYNEEQKAKILKLFDYPFAPAGTFGFERAEVTKGGVSTDEIDENFECKSVKNLYFIGEVLDVTGMLGGYNLHFAFTSAKILANHLNLRLP
ncbi:aminoacetone oxidase family FAD-binding enzyme [Campylobacter sp. RM15925]|uniref:NAD(P)/FAD-dependent oxidoreductase n=1 Tax=Campylobacter sp. RM15925 TaxID=1705724 RepID=UPI001B8D6C03|nr:aminoacetone oxidase family FAD-binding enzyme [Campylobacter sp. RM15925]